MFWIGLIVGIVVVLLAAFIYACWLFVYIFGGSIENFKYFCDVLINAIEEEQRRLESESVIE